MQYPNGSKMWINSNGNLHSYQDRPAVYDMDNESMGWYRDGKLHREGDLPAQVTFNVVKKWYRNGKLHRESDLPDDPPAIEWSNGAKEWYWNGYRHRFDDKPAYEGADGTKTWWSMGDRHRFGDKPAVIDAAGNKEWWLYGVRHRDLEHPAVVYVNGLKEWWSKGVLVRVQRPSEVGVCALTGDVPTDLCCKSLLMCEYSGSEALIDGRLDGTTVVTDCETCDKTDPFCCEVLFGPSKKRQ